MFVYNRVDNTQKTIQHLLANTLARKAELYVFSDGGKDEASWAKVNALRQYLHSVKAEVEATGALKSMTIVERKENLYLEKNITQGIMEVFLHHDHIIVLEDDICTSPYFLQYMSDAFQLYKDVPEVMHISGFTNLCPTLPESPLTPEGGSHLDKESLQRCPEGTPPSEVGGLDFYFTPHMSGWGWGTWRDRWLKHFKHYKSRAEALEDMTPQDMDAMQYGGVFPCLKSLDKDPIPWDICWEIAIYKAHGLCLTPRHTMVRNIGLKNGTHFRSFDIIQSYEFDRPPCPHPLSLTRIEHPQPSPHTEALFAEAIRDWGIRYTPLGKIVRKIYLMFKRKK